MHPNCTIYKAMGFLGKKWSILILLELYKGEDGPKRYSEVKRKMSSITPKMLAARLRELEKGGLVKRVVDTKSIPVRSEYSLTDSGRDFVKVIRAIKSWGVKWGFGRHSYCRETDCRSCEF